MTSRSNIIKDSVIYLSATIVTQGISLFRAILLPIILSPTQLGLWNLMNVVISYGANAHLGLLHGMNKAIPVFRGQKNYDDIEIIKNSVFWVNLFIGVIAAIIILFLIITDTISYHIEMSVVAVIILIQLKFFYFFSLLRADSQFEKLSQGLVYHSIFLTVFVILFATVFDNKVFGALIGIALSYLVILFFWGMVGSYLFPLKINMKSLHNVFNLGFPLILIGILDSIFISIDRWMIASALNVDAVGYYAVGIMINGIFCLIPGSLASALYPQMLERFSAKQNTAAGNSLLLNPLRAIAAVMLVLICFGIYVLPVMIQFFLPKYTISITVIIVFIFGSFIFSLSSIAGNYLISINKQKLLAYVLIVAIIIVLIINSLVLNAGFDIIGVAIGTVIGYSFYGLCYLFLALRFALESTFKTIRFLVNLIIPYIIMIAAFMLTNVLFKNSDLFSELLMIELLKFVVVFILLLFTLYLMNRDGELKYIFLREIIPFLSKRLINFIRLAR